jgi:hypothetical protein
MQDGIYIDTHRNLVLMGFKNGSRELTVEIDVRGARLVALQLITAANSIDHADERKEAADEQIPVAS